MNEVKPGEDGKLRCAWCLSHPVYVAYHDEEWGDPEHDDRRLFEMLILEGAQAGLNWLSILKRRDGYRIAYDGFDFEKVARYGEEDRLRLLGDARIIRNRLKVAASIGNARGFLKVREEFGSFDAYMWRFTDGKTLRPKRAPRSHEKIPVTSPESHAMSKDLRARGFKFIGPTICYSHMQACGMADDHMFGCFKCVGK